MQIKYKINLGTEKKPVWAYIKKHEAQPKNKTENQKLFKKYAKEKGIPYKNVPELDEYEP